MEYVDDDERLLFAVPVPTQEHGHGFHPSRLKYSRKPEIVFEQAWPQWRSVRTRRKRPQRRSADEAGPSTAIALDSEEDDDEDAYATDNAPTDDEQESKTGRRPKAKFPRADALPTHRQEHLLRIYNLLMLSIGRNDARRAQRCLYVLLKSHEWQAEELWRHALQVTTMVAADEARSARMSPRERDRLIAQRRLSWMRNVMNKRAGSLQVDLTIELIPELMVLGQEEQAMEEIDLVLNRHPFRNEPLLHLYSAMLYLVLSARALRSEAGDGADEEDQSIEIQGVAEADVRRVNVPRTLLLLAHQGHQNAATTLQRATEKFEMALTVGQLVGKRGRRDIRSASSRSFSRSRSRSKSVRPEKRRRRAREEESASEMDAGHRSDPEEDGRRGRQTIRSAQGVEIEQVEVTNDAWVRDIARAYLAVLRAKIVVVRPMNESEDDEEESRSDRSSREDEAS